MVVAAYLSRIVRDAGENLDVVSLSRAITYGRDTRPGAISGMTLARRGQGREQDV